MPLESVAHYLARGGTIERCPRGAFGLDHYGKGENGNGWVTNCGSIADYTARIEKRIATKARARMQCVPVDSLAYRVLDYRLRHLIPQSKFAELCRVTYSAIADLETGRAVGEQHGKRIGRFLE